MVEAGVAASARGAPPGGVPSGVPHCPQNFMMGGLANPQDEHCIFVWTLVGSFFSLARPLKL